MPKGRMDLVGGGTFQFAAPNIHQHMLATADKCMRKAFLKYILGLRPRQTAPSLALDVGTLTHTIHKERYLGHTQDEAEVAAASQMREKLEAIEAAISKGLVDPEVGKNQATLVRRSLDLAKVLTRIFWLEFPLDSDNVGVWAVEKPVARVWQESKNWVVLCEGRLDVVLSNKASGAVWLVDHKTSSFPPSLASVGTFYSVQKQLYDWFMTGEYGKDYAGFIYNYMQKPTIRFCKKDKTFEDYIERVKVWYKDHVAEKPMNSMAVHTSGMQPHPELSAKMTRYLRAFMPVYSPDVQAKDSVEILFDPARAPRSSCSCRWNRSVCPFVAICDQPSSIWGMTVKEQYEQVFDVTDDKEDSEDADTDDSANA